MPKRAGPDPLEVDGMCNRFSEVETEAPEWEPEPLPMVIELDSPPPLPRHDDAHDPEGSRVIVIDLV